ncbi:hypothetical protein U9M48_044033 [Paspalum notatum var. saurae]|uniref:BED-type domain-containing protein n=1 Tax=Paspalum notatum var. saurae TaxID=547442 RepID=A0AAQ3XHS9_PASNO
MYVNPPFMPEPDESMDMEMESVGTDSQFAPSGAIVETVGDKSQSQEQGTENNAIDLDDNEDKGQGRKEMEPRSKMWEHFNKVKDDKGVLMAGQCKYCSHQIKANTKSHGTSSLKKHFNFMFSTKIQSKVLCKQLKGKLPPLGDCWTSQQQDSYMTVTTSFIDDDWNLHKKVISFFQVKGHKGDGIGKSLVKSLTQWGLDRVMYVTVDNANGLKEVDLSVKKVRAAVRYIKNGTSRLVKFKEIYEEEKVDSKAFLKLDVLTR